MKQGCKAMQCPRCGSTHLRKNGIKQSKQNYICAACQRQFIDAYDPPRTYSDQMKQEYLKLYLTTVPPRLHPSGSRSAASVAD